LGVGALAANTTAVSNTAVGYQAAYSNTTGFSLVALGHKALVSNTTGTDNVAVGDSSQFAVTTGVRNTSVGSGTLYATTTGSYNVAMGAPANGGDTALRFNTTGNYNTAIGSGAAATNTTGSNNTAIGYNARLSSATVNASLIITSGGGDVSKGESTGYISPGGGGVYQGNNSANWSTTSDRRLKKNIVNNNVGLEKITAIQVRNFEYRTKEEVTELPEHSVIRKTGVQLGVIAQELQEVLPECVKQESTGVMSVDSDNLTWYMINAIKELKAEFDAYKASHP
jgi:hypothetical protein